MGKLRDAGVMCVYLAGATAVGCGVGGEPATDRAPEAGKGALSGIDEAGEAYSAKVYYGTPRPTHVPLSDGQVMAVGKFHNCSGALVAPRWVLTAAHCSLTPGVWFCMGPEAGDPDSCVRGRRVFDNPNDDMTLVELERDARDVLPAVEPIPLLHERMDRSWVGRTAEASGYGQNERGGYGVRAFTAQPIVALWNATVTIDGEGRRGVCFGDSGGPLMVIASDGSARVAGNLSDGDGSCVGRDNFTRVDTYRDWITGHTGPIPGSGEGPEAIAPPEAADPEPEPDPEPIVDPNPEPQPQPDPEPIGQPGCGDLDFIGRCAGEVVEYCKDGVVRRVDCAARGLSCDWHSRETGWWCVERSGCGDLDYFGRCDGSTAQWCDESGQVQSRQCERWGMSCGWVDDQTGNYCTSEGGQGPPEQGDPPPQGQADSDGDGISDAQDRCSATPEGSIVWRSGEWIGCAGGQFRD